MSLLFLAKNYAILQNLNHFLSNKLNKNKFILCYKMIQNRCKSLHIHGTKISESCTQDVRPGGLVEGGLTSEYKGHGFDPCSCHPASICPKSDKYNIK